MVKKITIFMILLSVLSILTFLFVIPSPIDPSAWKPPKPPVEEGALEPNTLLENTQILIRNLNQPEDLIFDEKGRLYTGTKEGTIHRFTLNEQRIEHTEELIETGGYPLGLQFDHDGNIIAAVKEIGLVSIDSDNEMTILTNTVENSRISYANELTISNEGTIYFTDSSTEFDMGWPYDLLEGKPHGRLLAYHPDTDETRIVIDALHFPNGVVLSPNEDFLLVAEMFRYRVLQYWLKGPKAHSVEIFAENLPLMPDNISIDHEGHYWVAGNKRLAMIDSIQSKPFIKKQMAKLPESLLAKIPTQKRNLYGIVLQIDPTGKIKSSFHDPTGRIYSVSSAVRIDDTLYLGTLMGDYIGKLDLQETGK